MAPVLRKLHDVRVYAAAASLILSAWAVYIDDVINHDGILYVQAAQLIGRGEWADAVSLHKWPFYSCLIALTSTITGLDLEPAAHLIDALLLALVVTSFITLVQILGGDRRTCVAAAILVLLYPGLNEYRSYVVRDFGYLGFYLLSLAFYFKAQNSVHWRLHAVWFSCAVIAGLFRIEGFALLLTMLILIRAKHWKGRVLYVKASMVTLAALAVMFLAFSWWFAAKSADGVGDAMRSFVNHMLQPTNRRLQVLSENLLPKYSADHAPIILLVSGITILVVEIVARLTVINAVLVGHAWYRGFLFPLAGAKRIWLSLIAVSLSILIVIVAFNFFLTGRFPLALSLILMLAAPFSLRVLYEDWRAKPRSAIAHNWKFPAVAILMMLTGLNGVTRSTDKGYLKEGALWIEANASPKASLLSNEIVVTHYAGRDVFDEVQPRDMEQTEALLQSDTWHRYDYLALNVNHRKREKAEIWTAQLGLKPVKIFTNRRNDQLLIFSTTAKPDVKQPQSR